MTDIKNIADKADMRSQSQTFYNNFLTYIDVLYYNVCVKLCLFIR